MSTFRPSDVDAVEALMLEHFRVEPFHNLHLLFPEQLRGRVPGGTCSDKTLSFLAACKRDGFEVYLHSGFIGGQEVHRLARVNLGDGVFFADVGNGWPSLKLYPADREISYECFGMGFRTEVGGERLTVFHEKRDRESLQLEVDVHGRSEADIRAAIEGRFSSGITYPFSSSVRYSQVVGDRFLFLRGDRLEIYGDGHFESVAGIDGTRIPDVLLEYFGYDLHPLLRARLTPSQLDEP